jgi:hypothetical protein
MSGAIVGKDFSTDMGEIRDITPAEAGHARTVAAGISLRHDCDYDPAFGCSSRNHARDVEALRDALSALGLLPDRRKHRRLR